MESSGGEQQRPKNFRRGETLIKEGEPVKDLFVIQSGVATINIVRGGKLIEIANVGVGQLVGEEALWGRKQWGITAVANNDVRALPLAVSQAFAWMGSGSPLIKVFLKGIVEKQRTWWNSLVEFKNDEDPTPCPPARITQLFAVLHHAALYTGTQKKDAWVVVWPTFKKYCQRTFLESPVRLEAAVHILVKLGAARLEMIPCETDPEAPDELGFVHFTDLTRVREFYEFYRAHYYARPPHAGGVPKRPEPNQATLEILREIEEWNKSGKVLLHDPDAPGSGVQEAA